MAMAMASCTTKFSTNIVNFGPSNKPAIKNSNGIVKFSGFKIKKVSLNLSLSSSHCICQFRPLFSHTLFSAASPPPPSLSPQPLSIVSAKGYKMKTHKASAKRFRVTGSGKIMRRRAGKQHLLAKKSNKRKLRLSKMLQVDRSDYNNVIGALPYLKSVSVPTGQISELQTPAKTLSTLDGSISMHKYDLWIAFWRWRYPSDLEVAQHIIFFNYFLSTIINASGWLS